MISSWEWESKRRSPSGTTSAPWHRSIRAIRLRGGSVATRWERAVTRGDESGRRGAMADVRMRAVAVRTRRDVVGWILPGDHRRRPAQVFYRLTDGWDVGMCLPSAFTVPPPLHETWRRKDSNLQIPVFANFTIPPERRVRERALDDDLLGSIGRAHRRRFGVRQLLRRRTTELRHRARIVKWISIGRGQLSRSIAKQPLQSHAVSPVALPRSPI